jgi:hypothetical protein
MQSPTGLHVYSKWQTLKSILLQAAAEAYGYLQ